MCYGMGCEYEDRNGDCRYHGKVRICPIDSDYSPTDNDDPMEDWRFDKWREEEDERKAALNA